MSQNTMHLSAGKLWKLRYYWPNISLSPSSPVLAPPSMRETPAAPVYAEVHLGVILLL